LQRQFRLQQGGGGAHLYLLDGATG